MVGKMSRHVLNEAQIRQELQGLCLNRSPHVQRWINSTFAHWIIHKATSTVVNVYSVLLEEEKQTRVWKSLLEEERERLLTEVVFFPRETMQGWAVKRLDEGETVVYLALTLAQSTHYLDIQHWLDFLEDRPARDIRMSVSQVKDAVKKWDDQLKRSKLIGDLKKNATLVFPEWSKHFPGTFLVRLDSALARKNEGDYMGHCTNKFFYRKMHDTELFSVRSQKTGLPLYTVEADKDLPERIRKMLRITQIKWRFNEEPLDYYKVKIINAFKAWDSRYDWKPNAWFRLAGLGDIGIGGGLRILDYMDILGDRLIAGRNDVGAGGVGRTIWDLDAVDFFHSQRLSRIHRPPLHGETVRRVHFLDLEHTPPIDFDAIYRDMGIGAADTAVKVDTNPTNLTNDVVGRIQAPYVWVYPEAKQTKITEVHGVKPQGRIGTWSANPLVTDQKPTLTLKQLKSRK
jgi:hypothetical protein